MASCLDSRLTISKTCKALLPSNDTIHRDHLAYKRKKMLLKRLAAGDHVGGDDLPTVSGAAERGPAQVGREHGALPETALLHAGIRTADGARQPKVSRHDGAGTDAANVRCQGGWARTRAV